MNKNVQQILGALCIVSTLAISTISCAPPSSSQASLSSKTGGSNAPKLSSQVLSSAASVITGSPSLVNLKSVAASPSAPSASAAPGSHDELDTFDGKNPFSDDSLWQIPVHLVRDLSAADAAAGPSADNMAKSASESSPANANEDNEDNDDDESALPPSSASNLPTAQSSSASPTIISASTTDLKTAAGYHYPTPHHGGYGGHDAGHYGGGHGGHHYGKYFQYASVPYPHAWEFGYRRGNPYHTIERYEHGKGPHFQTKVKWSDKHGGYGVHVWDYNHDDHHSHHYEHHAPSHYGGHHGYGHH